MSFWPVMPAATAAVAVAVGVVAVAAVEAAAAAAAAAAGVVVVVVVVVVRALYVFDDPLFWLPRNRRSKKILQNAVLRKGANLKKVQSSESGFLVFFFFRKIMMGRHKITVLRSVSGSACFLQSMNFRHNCTWQRSRKHCKTQHFCNSAILQKTRF